MLSSLEQVPQDLRRPCTEHRKDWMSWCWNRTRPEDRPAQVRKLKIISDFLRACRDLAGRAYSQVHKFGAQVMIAKTATRLSCDRKPYTIDTNDGRPIPARSIIIASGARYRRLSIDNLPQFEGNGVYYGATFVESQLCVGEEVVVVGGGNSAGQAAVFLAQTTK